MSPDPVNDHCAVRVILREAAIGEMPPLEALWRPERLRLANWKDRADEWRTKVKQTLEAEEPGDLDHFAILDRAKRVALTCARDISGVTGGRLRPSISNHSNEERRLQAHLRLLRVVRRDMYTRQGARPYPPSRSIKRAWDSTLHLQHAPARLVRTSGPGGDPRQARMSRKGPRPGLWMPAAAGPRPRPASVRRHTRAAAYGAAALAAGIFRRDGLHVLTQDDEDAARAEGALAAGGPGTTESAGACNSGAFAARMDDSPTRVGP